MFDKLLGIKDVIGDVIKPVTDLVDNLHTSEEEKMMVKERIDKIKNELTFRLIDTYNKEIEAKKDIIVAEAKGSWLQSNWRPVLMLTIVAIVANNYIVYPYLSMFTDKAIVLELPDKLWNLMLVGVGGYIAGRTGEKITDTIKGR
jgi:hypothetical protein